MMLIGQIEKLINQYRWENIDELTISAKNSG